MIAKKKINKIARELKQIASRPLIERLRIIQEEFGNLEVLIPPGHRLNSIQIIPHPVRIREGEEVRKILRGLEDCAEWSESDFDNNWTIIVIAALSIKEKRKVKCLDSFAVS